MLIFRFRPCNIVIYSDLISDALGCKWLISSNHHRADSHCLYCQNLFFDISGFRTSLSLMMPRISRFLAIAIGVSPAIEILSINTVEVSRY